MNNLITNIPKSEKMIFKGDERIHSYLSDIVMKGNPEAVYEPDNIRELKEIIVFCHRSNMPITFCGNQTSLTGSSVAEEGLLISTRKINQIIDIDHNKNVVIAETGIILGDLQDTLLTEHNLHYPPDPTSRREACLGATVSTNATGEDSFHYGSTRCFVHALKIILANGSELFLQRSGGNTLGKGKNKGGYYLTGESPIDYFIGSEGTLGLITEVTVGVIPNPPDYFSSIVFFPNLSSALESVSTIVSLGVLKPRCLEIIDESGLEIISKNSGKLSVPQQAKAALYFKQEFHSNIEQELSMGNWLKHFSEILKKYSADFLLNDIIVATTRKDKDNLRILRHHIPTMINERSRQYTANGGGKVSTDWWVPVKHIRQAINMAVEESKQSNLFPIVFGHIGNGHPHFNYIVNTQKEKIRAGQLVVEQCKRAVAWGGGVAGEHGIGKIKRHLMDLQYSPNDIKKMIYIKKKFDPHWILGRNNILSPQ